MKSNQKMVCPHCGFEFEEIVNDFVIGSRVGPESKAATECDDCRKWFTVERLNELDFQITKGR